MCLFNLSTKFLKTFQSYLVLLRLLNIKFYLIILFLFSIAILIYV